MDITFRPGGFDVLASLDPLVFPMLVDFSSIQVYIQPYRPAIE